MWSTQDDFEAYVQLELELSQSDIRIHVGCRQAPWASVKINESLLDRSGESARFSRDLDSLIQK